MTDGTSQGLFIVVAIVIFGIFVVLAYILFEDTLSPAMASMFTDATEQANSRLNGDRHIVGSGVNLISKDDLEINNIEYGEDVKNLSFVRSKGYIPVSGNTYYILTINSPWTISGGFWEYTEDMELTDYQEKGPSWLFNVKRIVILTDENTKYLRFRARDGIASQIHPLEEWDLMLEEGATP